LGVREPDDFDHAFADNDARVCLVPGDHRSICAFIVPNV
jgi:hypothetical protein